ncbi:choice-of-anchor M domain-containing protein [Conexibacter stalactiti]|uniref:Choice-of-anchor M domain-containing protein n=1 Tax=Conexibacter stalactiti TaxID=1940611 RepID=A0ABU4HKR0_9ACTN|nr:choice-of-anchor M domain-containing protein [Conexibacter stalactiti]MDW5593135.1 choice-of-anchor M domain-containing protein [Conexibacter stalactiti]MEC5033776.1 choice-of-anchor M domain-containing protein [Conexibacter stalactiti]
MQRTAKSRAVLLGMAIAIAASGEAVAAEPVRLLPPGHADLHVRLESGALDLGVHHDAGGWFPLEDTVVPISDEGRMATPPALDFLAPRGRDVWTLPQLQDVNLPWLGLGGQSGMDTFLSRDLTLTLEAIDGPPGGEVVAWTNVVPTGNALPLLSSRMGLPASYGVGGGTHVHNNWSFTAPGVYCLALSVSGRAATTAAPLSDRGQLTVAVGVDPSVVEPCDRRGAPPVPAAPARPAAGAVGGSPRVSRGFFELRPRVVGEKLDVALVERDGSGAGVRRDPGDVVLHSRPETSARAPTRRPWRASSGQRTRVLGDVRGSARLDWSMVELPAGQLDGDLAWRLKSVVGPGTLTLDTRASERAARPDLSNGAGYEQPELALWPGAVVRGPATWSASAPGVYCVELEWAGRLAGGAAVSRTERLTLAIDEPARDLDGTPLPATIDPATVVPCARETGATRPVVIDRGHVDLATRLLGGELDVALADGSAEAEAPTYRDLSSVVLHAGPGAARTVPADPAYGFLGAAGATAYLLPEVQDPELVWPGWSSDQIAPELLDGPLRWTLRDVRGPGEASLWQEDVLGGGPRVLFASRDGLPDTVAVPAPTHAHGNWGFERAGRYCLDMSVAATTASGRELARELTLTVLAGPGDAAADTPGSCDPRPAPPVPQPPLSPAPTPPVPAPAPGPAPERAPDAVGPRAEAPRLQRLRTGPATFATLRRTGLRLSVRASAGTVRAALTVDRRTARRLGLRPRAARTTLASLVRHSGGGRAVTLRLRPAAALRKRLVATPRTAVPVRLHVTVTAADGRRTQTVRTLRLLPR